MTTRARSAAKARTTDIDLRSFKRLEFRNPLVFRPLYKICGRSPNYMPGDLLEISLGGCRFSTGFEMPPGQRVKIRLNPFNILRSDLSVPGDVAADALELVATAEIIWREKESENQFAYGLRFRHFHQGDLATLDRVIEHLAR